MKSLFLAVAALSAQLTLVAARAVAVPANATFYNLQTKSATTTLNNLYLSSSNGTVGLFSNAKSSALNAARVFTTPYTPTGTLSLHIADDTHQIALLGTSPSLLSLVDVVSPTTDAIPKGQLMEWSTFTIDSTGNLGVKDGSALTTRHWVAWENTDGSYGIGLYDGVTTESRALANITITAVKAT
ncbi:hypothetical protein AOQ84DRAFT_380306 [Glonium stellatum]|uniref:Uncharacterized protein n=1 Tax=Glonium stellatum TaxID=574774 RepID=A0A8E2JPK7_9PEZI|nr:hypothetical protein AOQ84DRAFT_380306 [Glonium stellatum]